MSVSADKILTDVRPSAGAAPRPRRGPPGCLVLLCGPPACGKSTLARAIADASKLPSSIVSIDDVYERMLPPSGKDPSPTDTALGSPSRGPDRHPPASSRPQSGTKRVGLLSTRCGTCVARECRASWSSTTPCISAPCAAAPSPSPATVSTHNPPMPRPLTSLPLSRSGDRLSGGGPGRLRRRLPGAEREAAQPRAPRQRAARAPRYAASRSVQAPVGGELCGPRASRGSDRAGQPTHVRIPAQSAIIRSLLAHPSAAELRHRSWTSLYVQALVLSPDLLPIQRPRRPRCVSRMV